MRPRPVAHGATPAPARARAGDSWAHAATSRIILHWQGDARMAFLYKSPSLPARSAEFLVCAAGVRARRPAKRARADGD